MKKTRVFCALAALVAFAYVDTYAQQAGKIVVKRGVADTVYKAKHQIFGVADPGEEFEVNGNPVKAYKTGSWGVEIQLQPGENQVRIEDRRGNTTQFSLFYSDAKKPGTRDIVKEAAEAEMRRFYPVSLELETKKYSYLNY